MSEELQFPARARASIVVTGASVLLGARRVLYDVDMTVSPGSRIAVVGENGRGKSTLLHVLAGTVEPDAGSVTRIGTVGVAEQEMSTGTDDTWTVGDAVAEAIID